MEFFYLTYINMYIDISCIYIMYEQIISIIIIHSICVCVIETNKYCNNIEMSEVK